MMLSIQPADSDHWNDDTKLFGITEVASDTCGIVNVAVIMNPRQ